MKYVVKQARNVFSIKSKMADLFGRNGRGQCCYYQLPPRKPLYKNLYSTPNSSWVISQNVKCLITGHMVALLSACFNVFSILPWSTCEPSTITLALIVFEILMHIWANIFTVAPPMVGFVSNFTHMCIVPLCTRFTKLVTIQFCIKDLLPIKYIKPSTSVVQQNAATLFHCETPEMFHGLKN